MIRNEYNYANKPDSSETRYYKFDKNGKTIKSHSSQSHSLSEYNTSGQLTKLQELSPKDSTLLYSETRSYDKFGNQISSVTYDVLKKKIRYALTSEFTKIDAEKNWLRVKSYKDGKWTQYCEREITYYK
jgi:replication fork clamp-binding protein CrfC